MTVKELIKKLNRYPENFQVEIWWHLEAGEMPYDLCLPNPVMRLKPFKEQETIVIYY